MGRQRGGRRSGNRSQVVFRKSLSQRGGVRLSPAYQRVVSVAITCWLARFWPG